MLSLRKLQTTTTVQKEGKETKGEKQYFQEALDRLETLRLFMYKPMQEWTRSDKIEMRAVLKSLPSYIRPVDLSPVWISVLESKTSSSGKQKDLSPEDRTWINLLAEAKIPFPLHKKIAKITRPAIFLYLVENYPSLASSFWHDSLLGLSELLELVLSYQWSDVHLYEPLLLTFMKNALLNGDATREDVQTVIEDMWPKGVSFFEQLRIAPSLAWIMDRGHSANDLIDLLENHPQFFIRYMLPHWREFPPASILPVLKIMQRYPIVETAFGGYAFLVEAIDSMTKRVAANARAQAVRNAQAQLNRERNAAQAAAIAAAEAQAAAEED
jgi:hypothetical protein